jgi:hypothetical protein
LKRAACITVTALSLLAAGCCMPPISGRYEQPAAVAPAGAISAGCGLCAGCQNPAGGGRCERESLLAGHDRGQRRPWLEDGPGTPPGQLIPVPKFHPVPTRPVFQPQPTYLPLLPLNSLHGMPHGPESVLGPKLQAPKSLKLPMPGGEPDAAILPMPDPQAPGLGPQSPAPPQPQLFVPRPEPEA